MDQALPLRLFPALTGSITASFLFITFSGHYYQVLLLIPVALAISVLRYRLWEIDLILRRTLIYTTLTGALAAVYFGLVLLLQMLFRLLTGESSILAIVLSTLAITLLFAPLRSGLQRFIDRRFYRRRYNADRTLAAFTAAARTEVDLDLLSGELVQVVDAALQPEHVALWLRAPVEKSLLDQNRR